jgi:hypothetical protein
MKARSCTPWGLAVPAVAVRLAAPMPVLEVAARAVRVEPREAVALLAAPMPVRDEAARVAPREAEALAGP